MSGKERGFVAESQSEQDTYSLWGVEWSVDDPIVTVCDRLGLNLNWGYGMSADVGAFAVPSNQRCFDCLDAIAGMVCST